MLIDLLKSSAARYDVPVELLGAVVQKESAGNPFAMNPTAGSTAYGYGQLTEATALDLGVNRFNPIENMDGTAKYLRQNFETFGNWNDALRGYNQGPTGASNDPQAGNEYAMDIWDKIGSAGKAIADNINPLPSTETFDSFFAWFSSVQKKYGSFTVFSMLLAALVFGVFGAYSLLTSGKSALPKRLLSK